MYRFILIRIVQAVLTLLVLSAAVFFGAELTGDAAIAMAPGDAKQDEIDAIRKQLGLDRPVVVRYADYVSDILRGDFGRSFTRRRPVAELGTKWLWPRRNAGIPRGAGFPSSVATAFKVTGSPALTCRVFAPSIVSSGATFPIMSG